MRILSVLNFKGGTGKSSLTENLAHALALQGKRVLVIDADRQGNASTTLLGERKTPTLTNVLQGNIPLVQAIQTARQGLDVVPSDGNLDEASSYLTTRRQAYYTLRKAMQQLTGYDYVLFDHAGAYTPAMEAALLASREMLIPCELESYSVQGLFDMFAKLQDTLSDHEIRNAGIIPYNVDLRYGMSHQYLKELRDTFGELIAAPVRTDALVPKAQSVRMTVLEYESTYGTKSRAAEDFRTLAEDLIEEENAVGV